MGAINAQTDVGGEEVDPYSHDVLMQGMWKRGDEDVLDQEGDDDDMHYEMVTDADVKRGDVENLINLEPFYSYRRILKNQRWKRTTEMYRPAYGFGKRSPDFNFAMASPYQYHTKFMANPYGKSFYEI